MRLIDADALFKAFEQTAWYDNADRDEVAEEILLQMPTIDAVEVVRCKNCRYWDDDRRCNGIKNGLVLEYTDEDDFCSYGERGDDNA